MHLLHRYAADAASRCSIEELIYLWAPTPYLGVVGLELRSYINSFVPSLAQELQVTIKEAIDFPMFLKIWDEQVYNNYGKEPNLSLKHFARKGDWRRVRLAIRKGAEQWNRGMYSAARGGHKDLVQFCIEKGARGSNVGMHGAARGGHKDLVQFFIEKGAREWNVGMHGAARGGHKDLVQFFIEKGANDWNRAMHGAARGGHKDLVQFFITKGAVPTEDIRTKFNL